MNLYQEQEYTKCLKKLSDLWLSWERHWWDFVKGNIGSIRIDIKTRLNKHDVHNLLLFLRDIPSARLHKWKKSIFSKMNNYLLTYTIYLNNK